jgi:putative heme iron utilization protein
MSHASPQAAYARLVRSQRIAALGTLRDGHPLVSLVPYAETPDLSGFLIHISRLALHTPDILQDARVGLMVSEPDQASRNPQSLPRVSIQGKAEIVPRGSANYEAFADIYLHKFPDAAMTFSLGDFELYLISAHSARFVAGFGQIFNFGRLDFEAAAKARMDPNQPT